MAIEKKAAARNSKAAKKTAAAKAGGKAGDSSGFCVYLGPNIHGVIQRGTVYPCRKAEALRRVAEAVKRYPEIAALVVTGTSLPEARIKVRTPGNLLYEYYHRVLAGAAKTGGE